MEEGGANSCPQICVTFLCKVGGKFWAFQITPEHLGDTNNRVSR